MKNSIKNLIIAGALVAGIFGISNAQEAEAPTVSTVEVSGEFSTDVTFGDATAFTAALAIAGGTLGIIKITAGASKARVDAWADVGDTDRRLLLTHNNTGTGDGWLTVTYIQAVDVG